MQGRARILAVGRGLDKGRISSKWAMVVDLETVEVEAEIKEGADVEGEIGRCDGWNHQVYGGRPEPIPTPSKISQNLIPPSL